MSDRTLPGIRPDGEAKKPLWPWVLGLFGGVVVLGVIVGLATALNGDDEYNANTSSEAIAQCEHAIESRLKAPSTAEFDSSASGSGTWTVRGTVDSENGFGAMVRSSYQCTVIIDDATDTAKVRVDSFG